MYNILKKNSLFLIKLITKYRFNNLKLKVPVNFTNGDHIEIISLGNNKLYQYIPPETN